VSRYKLKVVPEEGLDLLAEIGKKRGCLRKGGIVDMHKAAEIVCKEIKAGDLGRISLDWPEDYENESDAESE